MLWRERGDDVEDCSASPKLHFRRSCVLTCRVRPSCQRHLQKSSPQNDKNTHTHKTIHTHTYKRLSAPWCVGFIHFQIPAILTTTNANQLLHPRIIHFFASINYHPTNTDAIAYYTPPPPPPSLAHLASLSSF